MPRKLSQLIKDLKSAGFYQIKGGKGSHRKFIHKDVKGAVILSGKSNADAKPYQEKEVKLKINQSNK